jgi:hypothetical protein
MPPPIPDDGKVASFSSAPPPLTMHPAPLPRRWALAALAAVALAAGAPVLPCPLPLDGPAVLVASDCHQGSAADPCCVAGLLAPPGGCCSASSPPLLAAFETHLPKAPAPAEAAAVAHPDPREPSTSAPLTAPEGTIRSGRSLLALHRVLLI